MHDLSEGGLINALLESGFNRELGFDVQQTDDSVRKDAYWFGEAQSRVVVSCTLKNAENLTNSLEEQGIPYEYLGIVTNGNIDMQGDFWGNIEDWKYLYDTAIERILAPEQAIEFDSKRSLKKEAMKNAVMLQGEVKGV
jgi:phosphoribosylformylglycinamidine synthase